MESTHPQDDVVSDLSPFYKIYKNGKVQRLMGTETEPPVPAGDPETSVQSKDVIVLPKAGIGARIYRSTTVVMGQKFPIMIYFHGGAFFVQSAFSPTYQKFLHSLVQASNIIIVSVDYRLAPENPLPIGYDDCWAAVNWVVSHSSEEGDDPWLNSFADFSRLFFSGDSAGANIAHRLGIRVGSNRLDGTNLSGIILMNPYFWGKDAIECEEVVVKSFVDKLWASACPNSNGPDDPWINPCLDPNLSKLGCDRVLIFVSGKDVLKHRGWLYCEALKGSGWNGEAEIVEIEGEEHVFHLENYSCDKAKDMVVKVARFINNDIH